MSSQSACQDTRQARFFWSVAQSPCPAYKNKSPYCMIQQFGENQDTSYTMNVLPKHQLNSRHTPGSVRGWRRSTKPELTRVSWKKPTRVNHRVVYLHINNQIKDFLAQISNFFPLPSRHQWWSPRTGPPQIQPPADSCSWSTRLKSSPKMRW